jgi:hypothetical protein
MNTNLRFYMLLESHSLNVYQRKRRFEQELKNTHVMSSTLSMRVL